LNVRYFIHHKNPSLGLLYYHLNAVNKKSA